MVLSDFLNFFILVLNKLLLSPIFVLAIYATVGLFTIKVFYMIFYK